MTSVPKSFRQVIRSLAGAGPSSQNEKIPGRSTDMDFVDGMKWGLSFMNNPVPFPGRRSAGSLTWGGLANSYYWIDPVKRVTGVWATQLLPFYDARAVAAFEDFERGVYASL